MIQTFKTGDFRRHMKRFLSYYRPHWGLFCIDMGAGVMQTVLTVLLPLVVYRVFHIYLPEMALDKILWASLLLLLLAAGEAAASFAGIRWGHILGVRMEADMRRDLFAHLQKLSFSYFDRTQTGNLMSRIANDLTQIAEVAHHGPEDLLIATLTMTGALIAMLWLNPVLTLAAVLAVPLILIWGTIFQSRMRRSFREVRKKIADLNSQIENSIQGIREVQSYCNEEVEIRRFAGVNRHFRVARENCYGVMAGFHAGMTFLVQSYTLLFIGAGAVLMYFELATIAEVLVFTMYARYFTMPIMRMVGFVESFQQGFAAFERFAEIMEVSPEIADAPQGNPRRDILGTIEIDHVSFRYAATSAETPPVLDDVTLSIPRGTSLALVGESGAGKTTLASLIPRFYDVVSGSVRVDGTPVQEWSLAALRRGIGIVRQTPFLFDATIRENILFGKPDATDAEVWEAAKAANILDFIESLPDGMESLVGEHGVKLSGGQRQRISLARIFLKDPAILIFDEATSSLDNESEAAVQDAIQTLCGSRTTIIIAHRLSTVRDVDRICCMRQGKIVETGTHEELLAANGYYAHLYAMHRR